VRFALVEQCPLCGSERRISQAILIATETQQRAGIDWLQYTTCECGFIFQTWAMTPETLKEYYKGKYREILGSEEPTEWNITQEVERADRIIRFLNSDPINVLDIGSSTGVLLDKIRDKYRCNVVGVEPGDKFRAYSHKLGLNVLDSIERLNGNQRYDLITMIHVLEHFVEPMEILETVSELMAENGKLIIEVPLLGYSLSHPIVFTEETFRKMLHVAGFKIDRVVIDEHLMAEAHLDT
jgi:SAM-dependent methyltransferase